MFRGELRYKEREVKRRGERRRYKEIGRDIVT